MELEIRENIIRLYDLYQNLLTEKQRLYFEDYYFSDLSISEIALNYNISRNGVHDQIKRTVNELNELEEKLKLNEKINKISKLDIDDDNKKNIIDILKG
jgi:predicted DNA-binding protein YlxM (UPF0122 family)